MTKEELEKATGQELIEQRDYCGVDGYYGDYLDDVNAEMLKRFNRLTDLEKENAELKETLKTYNGCGDWDNDFHTCRVYLQHEELQMYADQLTKAKEIIKILLQYDRGQFFGNRRIYEKYMRTRDEAEQFLNSELQSKWINPARTTNDNEIKLNSEVRK